MTALFLVLLLVLAAEFVNGWHDASNAIETVVSTRVLSPRVAVLMATVFNSVGAFSGIAVAATVGKGIVDPHAISLVTVASAMVAIVVWEVFTWFTPSERIWKKRSMIRYHSSGSTFSPSSIDPFTSANRIVTCLRSPSSAPRDVRIFSARCFGVYVRGSGGAERSVDPLSGPPQPLQNFCVTGFVFPQEGQLSVLAKGAAHSPQKFASAVFSNPQLVHLIDGHSGGRAKGP